MEVSMAKLFDDVPACYPTGDDAIKEVLRLALQCNAKILLLVEYEHTGRCCAHRNIENDPEMLWLLDEWKK
jgi:hypothetical protein